MGSNRYSVRLSDEQIGILKDFFAKRHGGLVEWNFSQSIHELIAVEADRNQKGSTTRETLEIVKSQEVKLLALEIVVDEISARLQAMERTLLDLCDNQRGK